MPSGYINIPGTLPITSMSKNLGSPTVDCALIMTLVGTLLALVKITLLESKISTTWRSLKKPRSFVRR